MRVRSRFGRVLVRLALALVALLALGAAAVYAGSEWLRGRPPLAAVLRQRRIMPLGRLALVLGKWKISADGVDRTIPRWGELARGRPFERGRYLASVICSECHGLDLKGMPYFPSPSLAIVNGYYPEQFRRLLRTGEHLSGRTDGLMSQVARKAFVEFTDQEIDDLYVFLTDTFRGASLEPGAGG